jgi:hypothetical protein
MGTGTKEDESSTERVWAARFHHVTARSHGKLHTVHFFTSYFISGRSKLRTLNQRTQGHNRIYKTI